MKQHPATVCQSQPKSLVTNQQILREILGQNTTHKIAVRRFAEPATVITSSPHKRKLEEKEYLKSAKKVKKSNKTVKAKKQIHASKVRNES